MEPSTLLRRIRYEQLRDTGVDKKGLAVLVPNEFDTGIYRLFIVSMLAGLWFVGATVYKTSIRGRGRRDGRVSIK